MPKNATEQIFSKYYVLIKNFIVIVIEPRMIWTKFKWYFFGSMYSAI